MEIKINLKKMHFFFVMVGIFLFSFVLAQTTPNPGHSASQVGPGTFVGSFTFDRTINVNQNGADFMSIINTNPSQNHVAILSNKNSFGVFSTATSNWADFRANNIQASGDINSDDLYASNRLFVGSAATRAHLFVVNGGSGTCASRCGTDGLCLGGWKMLTAFDIGSATCGDASAFRCLCAGIGI